MAEYVAPFSHFTLCSKHPPSMAPWNNRKWCVNRCKQFMLQPSLIYLSHESVFKQGSWCAYHFKLKLGLNVPISTANDKQSAGQSIVQVKLLLTWCTYCRYVTNSFNCVCLNFMTTSKYMQLSNFVMIPAPTSSALSQFTPSPVMADTPLPKLCRRQSCMSNGSFASSHDSRCTLPVTKTTT